MTERVHSTLAVMRCGDDSLHHRWCGEGRRFDMGVSYFGDQADRDFPEAEYVHRAKGGKWEGILGFFDRFPNVLERYDYFWFPDEDILTEVDTVNTLCAIASEFDLGVCQPSLDANSYYSYPITLRHASFRLRYTNFVEIMMPFLSRAVLKEVLPMFANQRAGFGLDFVFPIVAEKIADASGKSTAIIDSISVCHTRPVGGPLHKMIKDAGGPTPLDELRAVVDGLDVPRKSSGYGIAVPRIRILSGVDRHGKFRRGLGIVPTIVIDLLFRERNRATGVRAIWVLKHAFKTIL